MLKKGENYKYDLKKKLDSLPIGEFKRARKELPHITGYNWKTIYYQWCEIKLSAKRSIPSEPLDKMAAYLNCSADELKNYEIQPFIRQNQA